MRKATNTLKLNASNRAVLLDSLAHYIPACREMRDSLTVGAQQGNNLYAVYDELLRVATKLYSELKA